MSQLRLPGEDRRTGPGVGVVLVVGGPGGGGSPGSALSHSLAARAGVCVLCRLLGAGTGCK